MTGKYLNVALKGPGAFTLRNVETQAWAVVSGLAVVMQQWAEGKYEYNNNMLTLFLD